MMESLYNIGCGLAIIAACALFLKFVVNKVYANLFEEEDEIVNTIFMCKLEKHGDIVYAYTEEGKFLGQGLTKEEMVESVKKNVNGEYSVFVSKEELESVGFDVK